MRADHDLPLHGDDGVRAGHALPLREMMMVMERGIERPQLRVLTMAIVEQIDEKVAEAMEIGFADVTLEIRKGRLRFIRGPAPSEPVRMG